MNTDEARVTDAEGEVVTNGTADQEHELTKQQQVEMRLETELPGLMNEMQIDILNRVVNVLLDLRDNTVSTTRYGVLELRETLSRQYGVIQKWLEEYPEEGEDESENEEE